MPITDVELLRRFEKVSGDRLAFLNEVAQQAAPLDAAKVEEIVEQLTVDRFRFAEAKLAFAQTLDRAHPLGQRDVISNAYYAMYQAARAVVFHYDRADVDDHYRLITRLPDTLPLRDHWEKRLRYWRRERDQADYSPYSKATWSLEVNDILQETEDFLEVCRQFLQGRGISHV